MKGIGHGTVLAKPQMLSRHKKSWGTVFDIAFSLTFFLCLTLVDNLQTQLWADASKCFISTLTMKLSLSIVTAEQSLTYFQLEGPHSDYSKYCILCCPWLLFCSADLFQMPVNLSFSSIPTLTLQKKKHQLVILSGLVWQHITSQILLTNTFYLTQPYNIALIENFSHFTFYFLHQVWF